MSISVQLNDAQRSAHHANGAKWVIDDERHLVVLDGNNKAIAIYGQNQWLSAEVGAA